MIAAFKRSGFDPIIPVYFRKRVNISDSLDYEGENND
jgi:hypothetical protein